MDEIFQGIGDAIGSIVDNPVIQLGFQLAVVYWVVLWFAAAYWAFRDMQSRSDNALAPYLAAAFIVVFTPVLFPLAVLIGLRARSPATVRRKIVGPRALRVYPLGRWKSQLQQTATPSPCGTIAGSVWSS